MGKAEDLLANESLKAASRGEYGLLGPRPTHDEINVGSLQRIADACELMAKRYSELIGERDQAVKRRDFWRNEAEKQSRQINALKGVVTKLKQR